MFYFILLIFCYCSPFYALNSEQPEQQEYHRHRNENHRGWSVFFFLYTFSIHHGKYFQAINKIFNGFHKDESDFTNAIRFDLTLSWFLLKFVSPMSRIYFLFSAKYVALCEEIIC